MKVMDGNIVNVAQIQPVHRQRQRQHPRQRQHLHRQHQNQQHLLHLQHRVAFRNVHHQQID